MVLLLRGLEHRRTCDPLSFNPSTIYTEMVMLTRRRFLQSVAATSGALAWHGAAGVQIDAAKAAAVAPFGMTTVIAGNPRQRGLAYGKQFAAEIRGFLDREIYGPFADTQFAKSEMLEYAAACSKVIGEECPIIAEELAGMSEGSRLSVEEHVLITLHEELYHRGLLPPVPHCTAIGIAPPVTGGDTLIGQTWDWMQSVAGLSTMLEWRRDDGPSLLAYAFPGLWVGAGLNEAGLALCWTSADLGKPNQMPRIGLPAYVFLAHLMYQPDLESVQQAALRNKHAGWFTFVMGDSQGRLLNVEGSPEGITCEEARGQLLRIGFGTHQRTGIPKSEPIVPHARCQSMKRILEQRRGTYDRAALQETLGDPQAGICVGPGTIDMMVYDTSRKQAFLSRGPEYGVAWQQYGFSEQS
jgi:hypothetical protein